ncbi:MAG: transcriptional repressor [Bacillota bacterium]
MPPNRPDDRLPHFGHPGRARCHKRVHLDEACHSYAPASRRHHHHLVCTDRGKAVEFEGCDLWAILDAGAFKTGFEIEEHWLQFFGKCPTCQKTG